MPKAAHTHPFAPAAASLRRSRLAWESRVRVLPGHWYAQTARRISCFSWTRVGSRARCTSRANSRGRSSTGYSSEGGGASQRVHRERTVRQHGGAIDEAVPATHERAHPREQLGVAQRVARHVVSTGVERA
jgi:hypothetical protein